MTTMSPGTEHGIDTQLVVGLEIHVELATRSKMFTRAPNVAHPDHYDAEPNTLTDPVVLGMPGTLPVINKRAIDMAMLVGLALNCKIARFTKWDRKSYYYPDLPKNYQISQYDLPLCSEGELEAPIRDDPAAPLETVRIIRAHLEEDAGKLLHEAPGGLPIDHSIVDLNRAGTPLLEIVTYPDLHTPEQVVAFAQTLRNICRHLGVTEGIMQKGHIRFEPNINVIIHDRGQEYRTPIVEIKNLNSFKALHGAVEYEFRRQVQEWLDTGRVMAERAKSTRGWDDNNAVTTHQRHKEDADEYRYFPDPDLVPLIISDQWLDSVRAQLPELPLQREQRYESELGLDPKHARAIIDAPAVCTFFEQIVETGLTPTRAATILMNNLAKRANEHARRIDQLGITPAQIQAIEQMRQQNTISSNGADELFGLCCESEHYQADVGKLAEARGLIQVSDRDTLQVMVDQIVNDPKNAKAIRDIKNGKERAMGALMGQMMKLTKGQANPNLVTDLIKQVIAE